MSYSIVKVIYGVPLNEEVSNKMDEWEDSGDDRWYDGCGFTTLYSASGDPTPGYCGVELCTLKSYANQCVSELPLVPKAPQVQEAMKKIALLDPELRELAGKPDVYLIWSDA